MTVQSSWKNERKQLVVVLDAPDGDAGKAVADIRVEIGQLQKGNSGEFIPLNCSYETIYEPKSNEIRYIFDLSSNELGQTLIALTPYEDLKKWAVRLEKPIIIDNWLP